MGILFALVSLVLLFFVMMEGFETMPWPRRLPPGARSGLGFGCLAVLGGGLPLLGPALSRREVAISLLDARAGSPPTAGQLLLRAARAGNAAATDGFLAEGERWAAEVLESH